MDIKEAFKFCPRCSNEGSLRSNMLHCSNCGLDSYFSPKPVQSVILQNNRGEYLFVVRSIEPQKGYLDFPGGFVEPGETFQETSRRELKEELGIEVGDLKYLSDHIDEYLYQGVKYQVTGVTFIGHLPSNTELKPADDVEAVEFYKLEDIPTERLAWKSMHEMIANLKKQ